MKESEMEQIARMIDRVLINPENEKIISNILDEVIELSSQFPLYKF
jgi:glycine/serine hydroxymethyltransferase